MYNKVDYLLRGAWFAHNSVFPSKKKISTLMFYGTTLCDSKCKHCLIWAKRPVEIMPKDKIIEIMQSRCVSKRTVVGLEGGEFLLHPESMEILSWFKENHPNFDILSNCLNPERLIDAIKRYTPRRLYVSLDGDKETYEKMRGKDGYDKVIQVIEACNSLVPISLMFTLTPFNNFSDMNYVIRISKKYDIDVRIGIYNNIDFFNTARNAHDSNYRKSEIPANVLDTSENIDFLLLYDEWIKNNLKLRCLSIRDSIVIHPNGDIPICQNLNVKLGNVYNNSLDEIFNSKSTIELHNHYSRSCNQCWINFHRKYDIVLLRSLEKVLPKSVVKMFFGNYQWTSDKRVSYSQFLKENVKSYQESQ